MKPSKCKLFNFTADSSIENNTSVALVSSQGKLKLANPVYRGIADVERSPANEIFYFGQMLSAYMIWTVTVGLCSIFSTLVMHACGQFEVLMNLGKNLLENNEDKSQTVNGISPNSIEYAVKMSALVERHLRALR